MTGSVPRAAALVASLLVVAGLAGGTADAATVLVVVAAIAVAATALAVAIAASPRVVGVGNRAARHRAALDRVPAPAHPDTAGRPRPRAPGADRRAALATVL